MSCYCLATLADNVRQSSLRAARDECGFSREAVCRQLEPPVSTKTLERWEDDALPLLRKRWRLIQLAAIYGTTPGELLSENGREAA